MTQLAFLLVMVMLAGVQPFNLDQDGSEIEDGDVKADERQIETSTTYSPSTSPARPADCADHLLAGATESGVYEIFPFTCACGESFLVWCDMETDGGGWTVFLKRQKFDTAVPQRTTGVQEDFNRTWNEYKYGFGDPNEEYWMGNEALHIMTNTRSYTLRLDYEMASGGSNYGTSENVVIRNEASRYEIYLSGSRYGYTNSFIYMSYRDFTTFDRDYDSSSTKNCAVEHGGGFWYYNCNYFNPTKAIVNDTLVVTFYSNYKLEVTQLQFKIRPKICDATHKSIELKELGCGCNLGPAK